MQNSILKWISGVSFATLFGVLSPSAFATVIFDDGPTDGTTISLYIDGPGAGGPTSQTISDGFMATASGMAGQLDVGLWVRAGETPTQLSW